MQVMKEGHKEALLHFYVPLPYSFSLSVCPLQDNEVKCEHRDKVPKFKGKNCI